MMGELLITGEGRGQAERQTHAQTDKHINTMTWPGLGAEPSEEEHI